VPSKQRQATGIMTAKMGKIGKKKVAVEIKKMVSF